MGITGLFISVYEWVSALFGDFVAWVVKIVGRLGYVGIVLLMGLESSFVPFPSEVIIPPAGYLASRGEMNMVFIIAAGIAGSVIGSLFNYWLAARFGRGFLLKHRRWFFLNGEKFAKFETFFNTHGEITTFVGRLIPVVRQYISFPAGLVRMNIVKFILYTALGASVWVAVLACIGYFVGNNIELVKERVHSVTYIALPALTVLVAVYAVVFKIKKFYKERIR